jgi:hypothetical protein
MTFSSFADSSVEEAVIKTQDDYLLNEDTTSSTEPQVEEDDDIVVILPKEGIHAVPETKENGEDATQPVLMIQQSMSSAMAWGDGGGEPNDEGECFISVVSPTITCSVRPRYHSPTIIPVPIDLPHSTLDSKNAMI